MELIIEGVISRICKPQEFASGFRKCEVHVTVQDGQYPQTMALEFIKDDVDEALGLTVGAQIKARCNVRGREWKNETTGEYRAFMSLVPWKYELPEPKSIKEQVMEQANDNPAEADDFPF
jgi:hypothetical protein